MIKRYGCLAVSCWLASPGLALAHSPIEGIDNFYNGLLHPLFVPAHLLLLIAVGLFFGQQGPRENQGPLVVFLVAAIAGLVASWFSIGKEMEVFLLIGASVLGIFVAASPAVGLFWCTVIAALTGFFLGIDSSQETLSGRDKLVSLFGSGVGITLLLFYPTAFADYFQKKTWQKIGVRVIGSWVAASSLMVLALSFSSIQ